MTFTGKVLPIEVKSGKDYEKHYALDNVMSVAEYGIDEACIFTNENIKKRKSDVSANLYGYVPKERTDRVC